MRAAPQPRRPAAVPISLAVVCGLLGFLLVTASSSVSEARRAEAPRRQRLIELIQDRRGQVDDLDDQLQDLRHDLVRIQEAVTEQTAGERAMTDRLETVALQAGTVALEGPGIEVRLSDSDRPVPDTADAGAYRIHDRDLQLVVNALFAAGAEAVSVNGLRLVATSPIRAAGDTITVGFRPVAPPYVVSAIGAERSRFEASDIAQRFHRWTDLFGLGFRVRESDDLTVPPYAGKVAPARAQVAGPAGR